MIAVALSQMVWELQQLWNPL